MDASTNLFGLSFKGVGVKIYEWHGGANQVWILLCRLFVVMVVAADVDVVQIWLYTPDRQLINTAHPDYVLDVNKGEGKEVHLWTPEKDSDTQKWSLFGGSTNPRICCDAYVEHFLTPMGVSNGTKLRLVQETSPTTQSFFAVLVNPAKP